MFTIIIVSWTDWTNRHFQREKINMTGIRMCVARGKPCSLKKVGDWNSPCLGRQIEGINVAQTRRATPHTGVNQPTLATQRAAVWPEVSRSVHNCLIESSEHAVLCLWTVSQLCSLGFRLRPWPWDFAHSHTIALILTSLFWHQHFMNSIPDIVCPSLLLKPQLFFTSWLHQCSLHWLAERARSALS